MCTCPVKESLIAFFSYYWMPYPVEYFVEGAASTSCQTPGVGMGMENWG